MSEQPGYDPDAVKAERLDPKTAFATFLALMEFTANVDLGMQRDPYERWRRAKGFEE